MKDFFKLRESMTDFTNRDYKPGATDQEKRNAIKRKRADVEEGTWAIPETPKQKKELKNILKKPLPAGKDGDNASDKMYGIIGDDELFDDFYLAGKKNPKTDVRPLIKKAMKRLGIKEEVEEGKAYGPTGIAYAVKTGHPDEVDPKTKKKYPERQTSKYKKQWAKNNKESVDKISEEYPDGFSQTWRKREGMIFDRFDMQEEVKVDEATDVYTKDGYQVTRYSMGKGKLGFQFNYGDRGRYIQVAQKDLSKLAKAVQAAMKSKMNEEGGAGLFGTTSLRKKYQDETPGQSESTAAYAKSLEKIARDKQLASISDKDKQTLMKIAAMLAKEKKK